MPIQRASAPVLLTAFLAAAAVTPAAAQTAASPAAMAPAHHAVPATELIKVTTCHPSLNMMQTGGYYGGFVPGGFYRGGYWPDAYGVGFYQPAVTTSNPQLAIDYTNISPKTMKQIEFGLVVNGILRAEVKDVGTFSPNAEIKHKFGLSANVFPIQSGLPQCFPLRVTFADGAKWRNPHLPPKNQHIYVHP
jgi:hypothetical protein